MRNAQKVLWVITSVITWVLLSSAPAKAEAVVWKAKMWGPPGRIPTNFLETYAKEVAEKTKGQVKIEITYNAADVKKVAEDIKAGAYEVGYSCPSYYADKLPLSNVLDLPMFAPTDINALAQIQATVYEHPVIRAEMAKWNMRLLLPVPFPQYQIMGTKRIAKAEDFKDVKVRVGPGLGKVLAEYGAVPVVVPAPEIGKVMAEGGVDVVALPYLSSYVTYKVSEHSKYLTQNISLGILSCHMTVSQSAWDKLSGDTKKLMLGLRSVALKNAANDTRSEDEKQLMEFKAKGIEVINFPSSERARLLAKSAKYWHEWVDTQTKAGLKGDEIFKFASAKIREHAR